MHELAVNCVEGLAIAYAIKFIVMFGIAFFSKPVPERKTPPMEHF